MGIPSKNKSQDQQSQDYCTANTTQALQDIRPARFLKQIQMALKSAKKESLLAYPKLSRE